MALTDILHYGGVCKKALIYKIICDIFIIRKDEKVFDRVD